MLTIPAPRVAVALDLRPSETVHGEAKVRKGVSGPARTSQRPSPGKTGVYAAAKRDPMVSTSLHHERIMTANGESVIR